MKKLRTFCIYATFLFLPGKLTGFDRHLTSPEMLKREVEADRTLFDRYGS